VKFLGAGDEPKDIGPANCIDFLTSAGSASFEDCLRSRLLERPRRHEASLPLPKRFGRHQPIKDENLIRRDLTPAQRAKLIAARKAAYEGVHPETKTGGDRRSKSQLGTLKREAFVDDTAAKSGRSRTAVARDATRAKALGPDLDRIARTSLDKGAELDALAAMPAPERQSIVSCAYG
jgi:hypothetical protein